MRTLSIKTKKLSNCKFLLLGALLLFLSSAKATCTIQSPNFTTTVSGNIVTLTLSGGGYNSYIIGYGDATYGTSLMHTYSSTGTKTICVRFIHTDTLNSSSNCDTTICKTATITNTEFSCPIQNIYFAALPNGNSVTLNKYGTGYTSYLWDYGDGTTGISNTHTYTISGTKTICLKYMYVDSTNTARHCDTTYCKTISIVVPGCPIQSPNFTASVNSNTVTINLQGGGYNAYTIGYGDATYGTSLTHTYTSSGTKTICVNFKYTDSTNTRNCDTTICKTITLTSNTFSCPIQGIYFYPGTSGYTVTLNKAGSGYTSYLWNYGDGTTGTSDTHTYTTAGTKTVCLIYSYVDSTNTSRHCDTSFCRSFTLANTSCPIQSPDFTILKDGNIVRITLAGSGYNAYTIGYGDATYGTSLTHSYNSLGTKTICVNFKYTDSTNARNCDTTICKTVTITFIPFTCPIQNIYFAALPNGNTVTLNKYGTGYTSYLWDYGDGTTGTSNTHTYTTTGTKTICLKYIYVDSTNTTRHCDTTYCKTITIGGLICPIQRPNFTTSISGSTVAITLAGGGYNSYLINYGDNTTGTSNAHTYSTAGTKTICVNFRFVDSINNRICDTSVCKTITITSPTFTCPIQGIYFSMNINGNTVTLTKYGSGYSNYLWEYGDGLTGTSNTHVYTTAGVKTICLKYIYVDSSNTARHCDTSFCKTFTITTTPFSCPIQSPNFTATVHGDTVLLTKTGGGYNSYMWSYGDGSYGTDNFHVYTSNGTKTICARFYYSSTAGSCDTTICKTITITDACDSISCVLPGDADHDLTVNNFDVFAIGLSYNRTGPIRPNATTQYTLQHAPDWSTNSYYVFNDKFSDCNGNGVINNSDASVILQNYIAQPFNHFNHRIGQLDSLPPVFLAFDSIPIYQIGIPCNTTEITSDINVGLPNQAVNNAYGIGFSVEYPESFATDSCFRIQVDLDANSWFADNEPLIYLFKNLPQYHRVDIGIARTTGTNRDGHGKIGRIKFVVEDGIFRNGRVSSTKQYTFTVNNVAGVDNLGNNFALNGLPTTANFGITAVKETKITGLVIYPNPFTSELFISAHQQMDAYTIYDITGKMIQHESINSTSHTIQVNDLSEGMYLIEIKSADAISTAKIIKSR